MIYFILAADLNALKIGFTTDPWNRLRILQTGCPAKLELLAFVEGGQEDEARLHSQFAMLRKHGEWFEFAPTLQTYVATLAPAEKRRNRKALGGKLGEWLIANDLTLDQFGAQVGVAAATISRFCIGSHRPSVSLMEKIAHATQGAILPNDWFEGLPDRPLAQDRAA
jgi:hypothetical protein